MKLNENCYSVIIQSYMAYNISKVHFVGESGVDTGGLSRELWRLVVVDIVQQYCIGEPGFSLFVKNVPALQ